MKKVFVLLALLAAMMIAGSAVAEMKETVEFKGGPMGKVTFNHKAHQAKIGDCKACHHKDDAGKEQGCSTCHTKDSAVKKKDAMHNRCKKCHEEKKAGPTSCKECHKK